jgi:hypothetical protein
VYRGLADLSWRGFAWIPELLVLVVALLVRGYDRTGVDAIAGRRRAGRPPDGR